MSIERQQRMPEVVAAAPSSASAQGALMAEYLKQAEIPYVFGYPGTSQHRADGNARASAASRRCWRAARGPRRSWPRHTAMAPAGRACASPRSGRARPPGQRRRHGDPRPRADDRDLRADRDRPGAVLHPPGRRPQPALRADHQVGRPRSSRARSATIMRKAFRIATAERPGAVHLTGDADAVPQGGVGRRGAIPPPRAGGRRAAGVRARAAPLDPRPCARGGAPAGPAGRDRARTRPGATEALVALAEAIGCPWWCRRWPRACSPRTTRCSPASLDMACNQADLAAPRGVPT